MRIVHEHYKSITLRAWMPRLIYNCRIVREQKTKKMLPT
jgi:hypothetical protein